MILPGTGRGTIRRRANGGGGASLRKPEVYAARKLRRQMSAPEVALWSQLRGSKLGFKVRRQHPIGPYVADFFVRERRLVIETRIWRSAKPRRCQDTYMEERGYRILRIAAHDVVQDLDAVTLHIAEQVMNPLHLPSDGPPPHSGEDH